MNDAVIRAEPDVTFAASENICNVITIKESQSLRLAPRRVVKHHAALCERKPQATAAVLAHGAHSRVAQRVYAHTACAIAVIKQHAFARSYPYRASRVYEHRLSISQITGSVRLFERGYSLTFNRRKPV